tara:strand:- start:265 stop:666 length:402 start_codon:yes stop_codon:yes gene_type:complete
MFQRFSSVLPPPQLAIRSSHSRAGPHELLGIARDATPAEIDAAYRRMALKLHPDRNPAAAAAELFKLLPDAKRRALNMARTGAGVADDKQSEVEAQRREEMIRRAMEYKAAYRAVLEERHRRNENEGAGCVVC